MNTFGKLLIFVAIATPAVAETFTPGEKVALLKATPLLFHSDVKRLGEPGEMFEVITAKDGKVFVKDSDNGTQIALNVPAESVTDAQNLIRKALTPQSSAPAAATPKPDPFAGWGTSLGKPTTLSGKTALDMSPAERGDVKKFRIHGYVIQSFNDGLLVDCDKDLSPDPKHGYTKAKGIVLVRGTFSSQGTTVNYPVVIPDGFYNYTTVDGADARVEAYKLSKGTQSESK